MSAQNKSKETVLVITVGFLILYMIFKVKVFLSLALIIGVAGVLSSWLSEKIHFFWHKLSLLLGKVSNGILLTLVFFLVLTPVGLFRRLFKKNDMTRIDRGQQSNFTEREHSFTKQDLENTW